jgi:hypothetical protein
MSDILKTLEQVEKALSTPAYPGSLPTLVRENLDGFINRLPLKETNIRDRLPRKAGSGLAASWNVMTAMGVGNSAFAEGGTPNESATTYQRRSAIYKELGKVKAVTDRMIAAGKTFIDVEAELTEVALREVIQDEEQLIITGDINVSALQFDGIKKGITTNVIDDNNNALGFRTDLLEQGIETLLEEYAIRPTAIYIGYGMKRKVNQSLAGDVRVELTQGNEVSTGVDVGFYQSMIGKIPFICTFAIAGDATTYVATSNVVEDIYIVTEKAQGQDVIYMEDLYGLGKSMLDRTGAAIKFMVTEATVLVNRAEEFHVKIRNVRVK